MSLPLTTLLQTISDKVSTLGEREKILGERIGQLEEENANLRQELEECKKELEATKRDVEFLTMSHRLASSPDSIIRTRRHIARLIRTIDNCISMLKEE